VLEYGRIVPADEGTLRKRARPEWSFGLKENAMKIDFSGDEIKIYDFDELEAYRIACKMEADGIYFYSRMLEEMLKPQMIEVLELLLGEERNHLKHFEEKLEEVEPKYDVEEEGETLADIVDSKVFDILHDPERVADILCTPQEAVRMGIEVEKRSIAFYRQILKNTSDRTGQTTLQKLVQEEQAHLKRLEGLLKR